MTNIEKMSLYKELTDLPGGSGNEHAVRKFMKKHLSKHADEIVQDKLGSIIGVKYGNKQGPKIMVCGHMDEIGGIVVGIKDTGFIKMKSIGGIDGNVFLSQHMQIITDTGKVIRGIIGSTPPHINRDSSEKPSNPTFEDLLLDIGADSKEHALELGVRLGQQVVPVNQFYATEDGKKIVAKAWDDRWGCGMALELMEDLKTMDHPNIVYAGATVQEEVGLRGATTATQMINPDVFIALDCSPVGDFLDKNHPRAFGALGKGFLLRFYDPRTIMHRGLKEFFIELAEKNDIPYQYFLSMGGTDAGAAQLAHSGVVATTIGLPTRYIHSTAAMISIDDHEAAKKMLRKVIEALDQETVDRIKNNV
jgi:glutamyl aminopeptidase